MEHTQQKLETKVNDFVGGASNLWKKTTNIREDNHCIQFNVVLHDVSASKVPAWCFSLSILTLTLTNLIR
jgi:hypothetical protein